MLELKEKIIEALKEVYDPEIPINVYDLGLIYDVKIEDKSNVKVIMTLTSPTCPTADFIKEMVRDTVSEVEGVKSCVVEFTFEPMWSPKMVSKEVREEMGLFEDIPEEDMKLKEVKKEKICFSCGITDEKRPIVKCYFKKEKTYVCSKCLKEFN